MATTKLMHIKERKSGNLSTGLKNSINYIMNEEKTNNGTLVESNCGFSANEIYNSMMDTKRNLNKLDGRQGYHFIISFPPDENISEQMCMNVMNDFVEEYLEGEYDYVYSVHNDKDHMHGHLVFNSINRVTTKKYRYEDGDWDKTIQPIVDNISEKYGFGRLEFTRQETENIDWKEKIKADIDKCIDECTSYNDFCLLMKNKYNYQLKQGQSQKHGAYLSFKPSGKKKAIRSYNLPIDYHPEFIKQRIEGYINNVSSPTVKTYSYQRAFIIYSKKKYIKYKDMTNYQKYMFKKRMKYQALWGRKNNLPNWQIDKLVKEINKSSDELRYLIDNNLKNGSDINNRYDELVRKRKQVVSKLKSIKYAYKNYLYGNPSVFSKYENYTKVMEKNNDLTDIEKTFVKDFVSSNDVEKISALYFEYQKLTVPLKEERFNLSKEINTLRGLNKSGKYIINEDIEAKIKAENPDDYMISISIEGSGSGNLLIDENEMEFITRIPGSKNTLSIKKEKSFITNNGKTLITTLDKDGTSDILNTETGEVESVSNQYLYDNHYVFDKKYNNMKSYHKVPQHKHNK